MKMKLYNFLFFCAGSILMVFLLFIVTRYIYPPFQPHGKPFCMEDDVQRVLTSMNITDDQRREIIDLFGRPPEQDPLHFDRMHLNMQKIQSELLKEKVDREAVYRIHSEMKDLLVERFDERLDNMIKVRSVFTAQQYKDFIRKMEKGKKPPRL